MAALCDGTITQTFLRQQATSAPRSTADISPLRVLLFVLCVLLRLRFICSFLFSWFCCFGVLFCFVLFCLFVVALFGGAGGSGGGEDACVRMCARGHVYVYVRVRAACVCALECPRECQCKIHG